MKTKAQKQAEINKGRELVKESKSLVFADFSGMTAENLRQFRKKLTDSGAKFMVIKKRLLGLIFKENGIELDPKKEFPFSAGTAFSPISVEEASSMSYKFFRELGSKKMTELLGGYDLENNLYLSAEEVRMIGQLPSREVLLGQVMGGMIAPFRAFLYILNEKSKREA